MRRELRLLQNFQNGAERAVLGLIFGRDLDVGRSHAVLPDLFGREIPTGDTEAAELGAKMFEVAAGVNERTKGHVAANARKTVKISEFHGMPLPDGGTTS